MTSPTALHEAEQEHLLGHVRGAAGDVGEDEEVRR